MGHLGMEREIEKKKLQRHLIMLNKFEINQQH